MNTQSLKSRKPSTRLCLMAGAAAIALCGSGSFVRAEGSDTAPPNRSIAYTFYDLRWAIHETKDTKEECPDGLAIVGPREYFKLKFPEDGTKRTQKETELAMEGEVFWPNTDPDTTHFRLAGGKTAPGLNLDGKTKPTDFTSPDGKPGVDNELFRVIGCIGNYRSGAVILTYDMQHYKQSTSVRSLIEVTDVDSLVNDDDVTVTTYRGRDILQVDASANSFAPGASQRLDLRWGKEFISQAKGKIVNGVLSTEPIKELRIPDESLAFISGSVERMRDARFELKLTPDSAEGVIAGYADLETFYANRARNWSSHHLSYASQTQQLVYKQLRKFADAYPDPKTGENTAISSAFKVKMIETRILRSEKEVAETKGEPSSSQFASDSSRAGSPK